MKYLFFILISCLLFVSCENAKTQNLTSNTNIHVYDTIHVHVYDTIHVKDTPKIVVSSNNVVNVVSQCKGITKKGERCKRTCKTEFCFQHAK